MGFLSSRFNRPDSGAIHSSGIAAAGNSGFGSTSAESFSTRQQVDKNRMHIKRFQDATLHTTYRDHAFQAKNQSPGMQQPTDTSNPSQQVHTTRTGKAATSRVDVAAPNGNSSQQPDTPHHRHTTRSGKNASSRIDIVKSTRQGFNAGDHQPQGTPHAQAPTGYSYKIERPSFGSNYKEPNSRGYNPYS